MQDVTVSTLSHREVRERDSTDVGDELVLLLECDRPQAGSSRHSLLDVDEVVIGRAAARTVERSGTRLTLGVADGRISTMHATIRRDGKAFVVTDQGSKNGVLVNGQRVSQHLLRDGEVLECGRTFFLYQMARARPRHEPRDLSSDALASSVPGLATFHEPLAAQLRALHEVACTDLPVLVLGASGTGKELVSRAVHALSRRRGPFVGVNCGALPENLVEAELFGARKGAFTGATEDRPGLVRSSDGGTLFLDEIGDLPMRAQPAFLRVLQEREVAPIGATRSTPVNLRVVAATHRDLDALAGEERFRADLLARLSGFVIHIPTLRLRPEDFGLLVGALLQRYGGADVAISPEAMRALLRYSWPLNIRELEHCLRAALALSPTRLELADLPRSVREPESAAAGAVTARSPAKPLAPEQLAKREQLCALLTAHGGNISAVAREMGKDRVQIRRWIKSYGITRDDLSR